MEALRYYFRYCAGSEDLISIDPAAAEDDRPVPAPPKCLKGAQA